MISKIHVLGALLLSALAAAAGGAAGPDPRTAAGQLAICGGAGNWNAVGFIEFETKTRSATAVQGPFHYHWDRRSGFLRFSGPGAAGMKLDVALDLGSRSGGAWEEGKQLTGKRLADTVSWAMQHFGEDVLWLTFPLDWGAPGVTVTALPDATGDDGKASPAVEVRSPTSTWKTLLDPTTGRVFRTVVTRRGGTPLTVTWGDWKATAGVFFAHRRTIAETGETVEVEVWQAQPNAPPDAF